MQRLAAIARARDALAALLFLPVAALPQSTLATGQRPAGIDITELSAPARVYAAVSNSGEDSVSVFELRIDPAGIAKTAAPLRTIRPVPRPYAISACYDLVAGSRTGAGPLMAVTSPEERSIAAVNVDTGAITGVLRMNAAPYAVSCFTRAGSSIAVVSADDSTIRIVDIGGTAEIATVRDVPAARGLRGIAVARTADDTYIAAVASAEGGVVTVLDLNSYRVLRQVQIAGAVAVRCCFTVTSRTEQELFFINPDTLNASVTIPNIPASSDVVRAPGYGWLLANTAANSIVIVSDRNMQTIGPGGGSSVSLFRGISAPAAVAAYSWVGTERTPDYTMVFATAMASNSLIVGLPAAGSRIANAAGGERGTLAPGSVAVASFETGLTAPLAAPPGGVLPDALGGVRVRVADQFAPLFSATPSQVVFQVPEAVAVAEAVPVSLISAAGTAAAETVRVVSAAPGLFRDERTSRASVLNQDGSLNSARPAAPGSVIQIFATGCGATSPALPPGTSAPASGDPLVRTQAQPRVTIGGRDAQVLFSGIAPGFVGLCQINAVVPENTIRTPTVELRFSIAGGFSNTAFIAIQ